MDDDKDARHWEQVEEASELLVEGAHAEALVRLRNVIVAHPDNPYAYHFLGAALFELKELEAARDAYRAAVKLSPDYLAARVGLSNVLRLNGDIDEAIRIALATLERFPDDGDAHHAAGMAYAARGMRSEARYHLERYLATKPEFESHVEVRGVLDALRQIREDEPFELE
jgi:tetratricopeptide (TPR) repeat protein